ncbi:hypothetical protein C8R45DRAFT_1109915 [Mycena sanguinolenta]|nr:hypothetical protein C8R45DRAFT_1109915 [Mycena sanguinolenta]
MKLEDGGWQYHHPRRPGNVLHLALIVIRRSWTPLSMCSSSHAGVSSTAPSTACPRSCVGNHGPAARVAAGVGVVAFARAGFLWGKSASSVSTSFNPPFKRSARHSCTLAAFISHPALDHPRLYHALLPLTTRIHGSMDRLPFLCFVWICFRPRYFRVATGILDDDAEYSLLSAGADVLVACPSPSHP